MTDDELTAARRRIADLERVLFGPPRDFSALGLSPSEECIMRILYAAQEGEFVSHDRLLVGVYGNKERSVSALSVLLCYARQKLARAGIEIVTTRGNGYRLTAEGRAKLDAMRQPPESAA